ncbi:hypothetical protein GF412_04960 [Candidatus Micrarchaeota archaeon]|nr:hypothetical protein [Candidatus Micrarchaeota archaeon]MBD3418303.1 hypothetical protein [Candidatus Micrarchaeota archaeon]
MWRIMPEVDASMCKNDLMNMATLDIVLKEGTDFPYEMSQQEKNKLMRDVVHKVRVSLKLKSRDKITIRISK